MNVVHRLVVRQRQRGVALIFVLLMLIVITLLALNSAEVGVLQMFMAGNEQDRISAFERAESAEDHALELVILNPNILVVTDVVGYRLCNAFPGCTGPPFFPLAEGGDFNNTDYQVEITRAAKGYGLVPVIAGKEYSGEVFQTARFNLSSTYTDPQTDATGGVVLGMSRVIFK